MSTNYIAFQGIPTRINPNPITENGHNGHITVDEGAHREILISIGAIITLILIAIIVVLFIKCRKYSNQNGKQSCKAHNKTGAIGNDKFTDSAFTSSALYGHNHRGGISKQSTLQRDHHQLKNGGFEPRLSSSRGHSVESNYDQHNTSGGLLPLPHHLTPQTHDRYAHLHISNGDGGTLSRQPVSGNTTTLTRLSNGLSSTHELDNKHHLNGGVGISTNRRSGSESWLESSRSRETSPASSIPPGMPAFRVIPLCNGSGEQGFQDDLINPPMQNDPFAQTVGSTTFPSGTFGNMSSNPQRVSSTLGSDITSNPASDRFANYNTSMFAPIGAHSAGTMRATSESASNADMTWQLQSSEVDTSHDNRTRGASMGNSASALNLNGSNSNAPAAAPLLRRNQYWV